MKAKALQKLLDTVIHRRAVVAELTKATGILEAKLEEEMRAGAHDSITSGSGASARFTSRSSVKAADMSSLLKHFDARTMAALLQGASITQEKQQFLARALPGRDVSGAMSIERSSGFTISSPRSDEQKAAVAKAIEEDVRQQEEAIVETVAQWAALEKAPVLPAIKDKVKGKVKKQK